MKKELETRRLTIFANLKNGALQNSDSATIEFFKAKTRAMKNLFTIEDVITDAEFKLDKTHVITDADLKELCFTITQSSDDVESYYSGLIHYDHKDAVLLQPHFFSWLQENSCLTDPEIALLMVIIYMRLFAYDLQEVYDTLQSMNPEEDDIDDYSNSTIEVYDSSEFSDCDCEFQSFISEMIDCLEKSGYVNN